MAKTAAARSEPKVVLVRVEEEARNCEGEAVAPALTMDLTLVLRVGVTAAVAAGVYEAVMAPAGVDAGAGVPTTSAAEVLPAAVAVVKMTCGTVIAVDKIEVVEEDGIAVPDAEQGTTTVVRTLMVVTGTVYDAVVLAPLDGVMLDAQVTTAGLTEA